MSFRDWIVVVVALLKWLLTVLYHFAQMALVRIIYATDTQPRTLRHPNHNLTLSHIPSHALHIYLFI
jgi:hypothetical protein